MSLIPTIIVTQALGFRYTADRGETVDYFQIFRHFGGGVIIQLQDVMWYESNAYPYYNSGTWAPLYSR